MQAVNLLIYQARFSGEKVTGNHQENQNNQARLTR